MNKIFIAILAVIISVLGFFFYSGQGNFITDVTSTNMSIYLPLNATSGTTASNLAGYSHFTLTNAVYGVDNGIYRALFDGSGDYIRTTNTTSMNYFATQGASICAVIRPATVGTAAYQMIAWGENDRVKWLVNNGGTVTAQFMGCGGKTSTDSLTANQTVHLCAVFDNSANSVTLYNNGTAWAGSGGCNDDVDNSMPSFNIGQRDGGNYFNGSIGEVRWYNGKVLTAGEVQEIFNEDLNVTGTVIPPVTDNTTNLRPSAIRYAIPYNSSNNNTISTLEGQMQINFSITNYNGTASGFNEYNITIDGTTLCNASINVSGSQTYNFSCNWTVSTGFHTGSFIVDSKSQVTEGSEIDNEIPIYIPYVNRPYIHFNSTEWATAKAYCTNSSNDEAYTPCNFMSTFNTDDFNTVWTCNSADPRGKKFREAAMGCLYQDYNMASPLCVRAMGHVEGWADINPASCTDVQQIHGLIDVMMAYDMMFPAINSSIMVNVSKWNHDVCQVVTQMTNTQPYMEDENITGDNGKGFSAGIGSICYGALGMYSQNPTLIINVSTGAKNYNLPEGWMHRERRFLDAWKNDSYAQYQEGWLYKQYFAPRMVEVLMFEKRAGLNNISQYQNAICAMGREDVSQILDFTYNGLALRGDNDQTVRAISRGDSMSYERPADGGWIGNDLQLYYGLLCDDTEVKATSLWMKSKYYNNSIGTLNYPSAYLYKLLYDQVTTETNPQQLSAKVQYDNANDIFSVRSGYSFVNDTIWQVDGGEEKGGGHSMAQGDFLYAFGEPFLDREQVPLEDDVRAETWKNAISFVNTTQQAAGKQGQYSTTCGASPLNQYYGSYNCPSVPTYPGTYPDDRQHNLTYGGDIEDYIGTESGQIAAVFKWLPYDTSSPVEQYYIKIDNIIAERAVIKSNTATSGIYRNFIGINNEFNYTVTGSSLVLNRTNKYVKINTTYSNETWTMGGGKHNVTYSFTKTGSAGGLGSYRRHYLTTTANTADLIFFTHWYTTGTESLVESLTANPDKGMHQGNYYIYFDVNADGNTTAGSRNVKGWGFFYNDVDVKFGAFNSTFMQNGSVVLFNSSSPTSVILEMNSSKVKATLNTMVRNTKIDFPSTVQVTINAYKLTDQASFNVKKNGVDNVSHTQDGTKVTFYVTTDQNGDYYDITGLSAGGSLNLSLNSVIGDVRYELGTPILVNYSGGSSACLATSHPNYTTICSVTSGLSNFSFKSLYVSTFNDSTNTKTIASSSSLIGLRTSNLSEHGSFEFNVSSTNESENVTIDLSNDGSIDYRLPGKLGSNYLRIDKFGGVSSENIDFLGTGSKVTRNVDMPNTLEYSYYLNFKVAGEVLTQNFTLNFDTNNYKDSFRTESDWNISAKKLLQLPTSVAHKTYFVAGICGGGGTCYLQIDDNTSSSSNIYASQYGTSSSNTSGITLNNMFDDDASTYTGFKHQVLSSWGDIATRYISFNNTINTTLNYILNCFGGVGSSDSSNVEIYLYNSSASNYDFVSGLGCGEDINSISSGSKITVGDYINSTGQSNLKIISEIDWDKTLSTPAFAAALLTLDGIQEYDWFDNRSSTFQNTTTVKLLTLPANITNISIQVNTSNQSTDNIVAYISNDNGLNFEQIGYLDKKFQHNFTHSGSELMVRFILGTNDKAYGSWIRNVTIFETTTQYPTNISIDLGDDNNVDYKYVGVLNSTVLNINMTLNISSEFAEYYSRYCDDKTMVEGCSFPIAFRLDSTGRLVVSNMTMMTIGTESPTSIYQNLNISGMDCNTIECNVPMNISFQSGSSFVMNYPKLGYLGHGNVTFNLSEGTSSVTRTANIYYSGYNYTMPFGIDYLEFIPKSQTAKNVTPYGQSRAQPIFNITIGNKVLPSNFSILIDADMSCVNLTASTTENKSNGVKLVGGVWNNIYTSKTYRQNLSIRLWADYQCSYTNWGLFQPTIYFRGCTVDSLCDEAIQ